MSDRRVTDGYAADFPPAVIFDEDSFMWTSLANLGFLDAGKDFDVVGQCGSMRKKKLTEGKIRMTNANCHEKIKK